MLGSVAFVIPLFGCVVLHELGHALAARYFGIKTRDITLYPIGGVARLERMSEKPWEELCISLAGPVVNAGLALVFLLLSGVAYLIWNAAGGVMAMEAQAEEVGLVSTSAGGFLGAGLTVIKFLWLLVMANVMLGVFNLLPAFPMDGGRVLRSLLAMVLPRLRATEIAANIGALLALMLAGLALLTWTPMLLLLAAFVFLAGRQELMALRYKEMVKTMPPQDAGQADNNDVNPVPQTAIPDRFTGILWDGQARVWVVWKDGQPVGTIGGGRSE
jgi:Zn-dependent protease